MLFSNKLFAPKYIVFGSVTVTLSDCMGTNLMSILEAMEHKAPNYYKDTKELL